MMNYSKPTPREATQPRTSIYKNNKSNYRNKFRNNFCIFAVKNISPNNFNIRHVMKELKI